MNNEWVMLRFRYEHLPSEMQEVGKYYHELAERLCKCLPDCDDKWPALLQLLSSRTAVFTAMLAPPPA